MSKMNNAGPMSEGPGVPAVKKAMDPSSYEGGTSMHPGFKHNEAKFTGRTPGKHKSFKREPLPKTP